MRLFWAYLGMQARRMLRVLPPVLGLSLAFCLVGGLAARFFVPNASSPAGGGQRVSIGVVGNMDEPFLEFGINAVRTFDSSRMSVELRVMTLEAAQAALYGGAISAYAVIPDGFVNAIRYGENDRQIVYVAGAGQQGFGELIKSEVADIISTQIVHSQAGVFAMQELLWERRMMDRYDALTYDINVKYVDWVLERGHLATLETLGISGGLSIESYFLCSAAILFLMLVGISASPYFTSRSRELCRVFCGRGLAAPAQFAGEYVPYLLLMELCLAGLLVLAGAAQGAGLFAIREWRFVGAARGLLSLYGALVPVVAVCGLLQFVLYEAAPSVAGGVGLQFLAVLALCWTGGCFYPLAFFPDAMQAAGRLNPVGMMKLYADARLAGAGAAGPLRGLLLYGAAFCAGGVLLRHTKVRR